MTWVAALKKLPWEVRLKELVRSEHGSGWRLREKSGKAQITLLLDRETQKRTSGDLGIDWSSSQSTAILTGLRRVVELVNGGQSLREALKTVKGAPLNAAGTIDWVDVQERYEQSRVDNGPTKQRTYDRNERYKIERVVDLVTAEKEAASNGREVMRLYAAKHLDEVPAGGTGRQRNLLDVKRFLKFAVNKCGADKQWLPLEGEDHKELLGTRETPKEDKPPIKPEQLAALLDSLYDKPEVRLAVALVGLFGLRPSELMTLEVKDGKLYVGDTKRNLHSAKTGRKVRLTLALDLKELPGEGKRVIDQYATGKVQLPTSVRNAKDYKACGDYFRQYLERHGFWRELQQQTPGLSPYSLRHGYAWRGVKYYGRSMPLRDLAALMGHDVKTHMRHYGKWTDEEGLIQSVGAITNQLVAA